ncbi:amidase [Mesorhizobium delmotii]|uniref:Amidase n=1 Tax=Mesorhizobium delmotii TaxID=1631247 RepID=A0A2P9AGP9_9HYPH|nr:amidase family protein [Mesorhizobium delmotii]SJM30315.1 Amidase [Mesorhizobium delmotii]
MNSEAGEIKVSQQELIRESACGIVEKLTSGVVTPLDLLDVLEKRISDVDGKVNALPILCFDRARKSATELMKKPISERGLLAGLPVPIKDLTDVSGVRTTSGSRIFKDNIPAGSDILVERLEENGALIYAKSNVPEFGSGANTFNEVFGATLNPWDTSRSAAGSSGGAAVALATGMAWLAHGSDCGGSLRNPASFCGVVGLRPSIGRVARTPNGKVDTTLGSVSGPMARNVEDVALMLDAMSGQHPGDPLSLPKLAVSFLSAARLGKKPKRVAYSPDLGITPVDPQVAAITRAAAERFEEAGGIVEEAHPDFSEAHECFHVLRAFDYVGMGALLRKHRELIKPEVIWNIEEGLRLTVEQVAHAEMQRVAMTARAVQFFETYDLLLTPATIVEPFPVQNRYVNECASKMFDNYVQWLGIAYAITLACCPALSLPCGFTESGLPVGLQIVASPGGEARLLAGAKVLENVLDLRRTTPIDSRGTEPGR